MDEASRVVRQQVKVPHDIMPLTVFLVFLLLYFNTRSLAKTAIVLLAVPFWERS